MPRGRKAGSVTETLEQQIGKAQLKVIKTKQGKAQLKVIKTKQAYDTAVGALQKLLDKRDAQRKEELWNAIIKSEKTYDEILTFITAGQTTEEE